MDSQYIVAIVAGSVFLILFVSFLIAYAVRCSNARKFRRKLDSVFLDGNLAKMEYDFAVYDEETAKLLANMSVAPVEQVTIDELLSDGKPVPAEEVFAKIDSEGMEEITGNYKPE